jgi:trans-2,3-dihydro-3-hydroxyanthranilate isomerase
MQALAGEFNLSETTFVLPPDDPRHTAKVRIFTPSAEIGFAGHPNIGTAWMMAAQGPEHLGTVPATSRRVTDRAAWWQPKPSASFESRVGNERCSAT